MFYTIIFQILSNLLRYFIMNFHLNRIFPIDRSIGYACNWSFRKLYNCTFYYAIECKPFKNSFVVKKRKQIFYGLFTSTFFEYSCYILGRINTFRSITKTEIIFI